MNAWYYDRPATPSQLASLTSAQRSERAHWQHEVRRGLAEAAPPKQPRLGRLRQWLLHGPDERLPPRAVRPAC